MDDTLIRFFQIPILLFSVVLHEITHGAVALAFGDPTAKDQKRLSLNPLRHLDLFGSIILPVTLLLLKAPPFGWAKPVPYNPFLLRKPRLGAVVVGIAGPVANLVLAVVFAVGLRVVDAYGLAGFGQGGVAAAFALVIFVNLYLAFFNLIPIPPLDGSKLLYALIPDRYIKWKVFMERYGLFLFIIFIFQIARYLSPLVYQVFLFLTTYPL